MWGEVLVYLINGAAAAAATAASLIILCKCRTTARGECCRLRGDDCDGGLTREESAREYSSAHVAEIDDIIICTMCYPACIYL